MFLFSFPHTIHTRYAYRRHRRTPTGGTGAHAQAHGQTSPRRHGDRVQQDDEEEDEDDEDDDDQKEEVNGDDEHEQEQGQQHHQLAEEDSSQEDVAHIQEKATIEPKW